MAWKEMENAPMGVATPIRTAFQFPLTPPTTKPPLAVPVLLLALRVVRGLDRCRGEVRVGGMEKLGKIFDIFWKLAVVAFLWAVWWEINDQTWMIYSIKESIQNSPNP